MNLKQDLALAIEAAMIKAFGQAAASPAMIGGALELPPDSALGDYAFPCFTLSKTLRMAPPAIAAKLAEAWDAQDLAQATPAGGYLNFALHRGHLAQRLMPEVLAADDRWGASDMGQGRKVCLDYSSINITKRFHIGHLSTTMIGHSLSRIYAFQGYEPVRINHLGDWGTQFGKMISTYLRWGDKAQVEAQGVQALEELYVRFHEEAEKDPVLEDEARAWFKKIEENDPQAMELFEWFKQITLIDVERVYDLLEVEFDSYAGESFYNDKMQRVVDELREKNLLVESEGAMVVDLEAFKMPPCIILKKDGATLYATRDIAAAIYRKETYDFARSLYVVAYQQDLHFRQVFKVIELMGYDWWNQLEHVSYGMVSFEGQTLSTRKGHMIYLDDLLERATQKALDIIKEKSPGLENKEDVARQVGIGAVVYATLSNGRIKDIDFWWERALNFDGETGPYVQYTYARCGSLLRKAPEILPEPDWSVLTDDEAQAVMMMLARFPEVVREAMDRNEPSMVTRHTTWLAQAYNKFYFEHRILDGDPGAVSARVGLTRAVRQVIQTGLYLIGMQAPEHM